MNATASIAAFASRKLREDETRKSTHIVRAGVALVVLILLAGFIATAGQSDAPGLVLLNVVIWVNVAAVMLVALTSFTPVLAEERDAGTLPLLKLCSEADRSVLLGLTLPRLSFALALLAVQIPFALLAVTLGGVTPRQVLGCYFCLCASTILLSAVTTAAATLTKTVGGVVQLLFAYAFTLVVCSFIGGVTIGQPIENYLFSLYAAFPGIEIAYWLSDPNRPFIGPYLGSVVVQTLIAIVIAWIVFPVSDVTGTVTEGPTLATKLRLYAARNRKFAPRNFDKGPHAWKDYHLVAGGHVGLAMRTVMYLVFPTLAAVVTYIYQLMGNSSQSVSEVFSIFAATLGTAVSFGLPIECAWLAARRVRLEIDDSAWELLELLPTSRQFILSGKGTGTIRGLFPGLILGVLALFIAGAAEGVEEAFAAMLIGGFFSGIMMCAALVTIWFTASHAALHYKAGVATGITIVAIYFAIPFLFVMPMMLFSGLGLGMIGFLFSMLLIPAGLGLLVAAITTFSNRFYKRALQGND